MLVSAILISPYHACPVISKGPPPRQPPWCPFPAGLRRPVDLPGSISRFPDEGLDATTQRCGLAGENLVTPARRTTRVSLGVVTCVPKLSQTIAILVVTG